MTFSWFSHLLIIAIFAPSISTQSQVFCEPPEINVSLGDAELRTDQNFTCAYNARICPVVFSDTNNNGIKDTGEIIFRGVEVQLTNTAETTVFYNETTDNGENACFAPLSDGETYHVRIPNLVNGNISNWPSTIITTTGNTPTSPNIQQYTVSTTTGTQIAYFGFSPGAITFNVPTSVVFPDSETKNIEQTTQTVVNPIVVNDTRGSITGWSITGVVENFVSVDNLATIPVANGFTSTPGNITINSGTTTGITAGALKTVTSSTNPFTVFQGQNNNGVGQFSISQGISLKIPPVTPSKDYRSVITYTLVN
jgi:hypothetical protein